MFRSEKYLSTVRSSKCVALGCCRDADHAHHFGRRQGGGGVGLKPHDTYTAPLCAEHHGIVHQTGQLPGLTVDGTDLLFLWFALRNLTYFVEKKP
jgi:hypothetical protein